MGFPSWLENVSCTDYLSSLSLTTNRNNPICSARFECRFVIILHGPGCHRGGQAVSLVLSTKPQAGKITPYLLVHKESYGPMTLATPNYRLSPSPSGNSCRKTVWQPTQDNRARVEDVGQGPFVCSSTENPNSVLLF